MKVLTIKFNEMCSIEREYSNFLKKRNASMRKKSHRSHSRSTLKSLSRSTLKSQVGGIPCFVKVLSKMSRRSTYVPWNSLILVLWLIAAFFYACFVLTLFVKKGFMVPFLSVIGGKSAISASQNWEHEAMTCNLWQAREKLRGCAGESMIVFGFDWTKTPGLRCDWL